jgi:phage major head subunit gpT-like protein
VTVPQELNWVEKRAACTVGMVFNQLCDEIQKDATSVNTIQQLPEGSQFMAQMHSDGSTIFVAQPNRIVVKEEWRKKTWSVAIGLNNEGRCTLRLDDGTELEQWQFRKMALSGLFFGD